jgi:hypothetical protein
VGPILQVKLGKTYDNEVGNFLEKWECLRSKLIFLPGKKIRLRAKRSGACCVFGTPLFTRQIRGGPRAERSSRQVKLPQQAPLHSASPTPHFRTPNAPDDNAVGNFLLPIFLKKRGSRKFPFPLTPHFRTPHFPDSSFP